MEVYMNKPSWLFWNYKLSRKEDHFFPYTNIHITEKVYVPRRKELPTLYLFYYKDSFICGCNDSKGFIRIPEDRHIRICDHHFIDIDTGKKV